jgi:hypothetical protein
VDAVLRLGTIGSVMLLAVFGSAALIVLSMLF